MWVWLLPILMDDANLDSLVERFYRSLYHFALSLSRSETVAADLTQETYYIWAAKGHQLRDPSKLKSWMFTTLHREFLRRKAHSDRFQHYETSQVESELPVIASTVVNDLDSVVVMQALQRVDENYRIPLAMFYLENFSYKEIAESLEVPVGTVMSRLARGKGQLRVLIGEVAAGCGGKVISLPDPGLQSKGSV